MCIDHIQLPCPVCYDDPFIAADACPVVDLPVAELHSGAVSSALSFSIATPVLAPATSPALFEAEVDCVIDAEVCAAPQELEVEQEEAVSDSASVASDAYVFEVSPLEIACERERIMAALRAGLPLYPDS